MPNALKKAIDTVASMFTPDELTRSLQDKEAAAVKLEKASSDANINYKAKIVDPATAEKFRQEKLRLDAELGSIRDDITALKQMHEDATRDRRLAERAKQRAAIEARVKIDLKFLQEYAVMTERIDAGLNHLSATEDMARRFSRDAVEDETRIATAEGSRHPPGTQAFDAKRPLAECVNLPAAGHGDRARRASRLA